MDISLVEEGKVYQTDAINDALCIPDRKHLNELRERGLSEKYPAAYPDRGPLLENRFRKVSTNFSNEKEMRL